MDIDYQLTTYALLIALAAMMWYAEGVRAKARRREQVLLQLAAQNVPQAVPAVTVPDTPGGRHRKPETATEPVRALPAPAVAVRPVEDDHVILERKRAAVRVAAQRGPVPTAERPSVKLKAQREAAKQHHEWIAHHAIEQFKADQKRRPLTVRVEEILADRELCEALGLRELAA